MDKLDEKVVNTMRVLSVEMIQKAKSGHPGLPLGAAPMMYALWSKCLNVNPNTHLDWPNRDRFVLSAGHGSALLYSTLHLAGYDVTIDDLKQFRQLGSRTPGHPEYGITDGVEATAGPLGQGMAMAVGMAMAEAHLASVYNRPGYPVMDHYTYTLVGDGDLMEGISQEAISYAGHLKLGKLIVLYDSNDISLDGPLSNENKDNVKERFEASHWHYQRVENGNNIDDIIAAIQMAKTTDEPSIIEIKTTIGFGSPLAGTNKVHGAPIGEEGIQSLKQKLNYSEEEFTVDSEVYGRFREQVMHRGQALEDEWNRMMDSYEKEYPSLAQQFKNSYSDRYAKSIEVPHYKHEDGAIATRTSGHQILQKIAQSMPCVWGGSADLMASNNTNIEDEDTFLSSHYAGRNIEFGVREFGMAAMMNGIALHGGTRIYGSTFFVFADYLRAAIRMAALQQLPVTYILTHDSIAVGEDGPTHEPIEQLASLRAMPNLNVLRPADANEAAAAYQIAFSSRKTPTILVLSRQKLPTLNGPTTLNNVEKGAYVISPSHKDKPEGILIATGSEVSLAIEAQKSLREKGYDFSVVSMPSMELFEQQSIAYQDSVLPSDVDNRISIEMGSSFGWDRYANKHVAIDTFGASGKGNEVTEKFGFTVENIVNKALD